MSLVRPQIYTFSFENVAPPPTALACMARAHPAWWREDGSPRVLARPEPNTGHRHRRPVAPPGFHVLPPHSGASTPTAAAGSLHPGTNQQRPSVGTGVRGQHDTLASKLDLLLCMMTGNRQREQGCCFPALWPLGGSVSRSHGLVMTF